MQCNISSNNDFYENVLEKISDQPQCVLNRASNDGTNLPTRGVLCELASVYTPVQLYICTIVKPCNYELVLFKIIHWKMCNS